MSILKDLQQEIDTAIETALTAAPKQLRSREVGSVTHIGGGIARATGLPGLGAEELVRLPGGVLGIAINLSEADIGIVLLGDSDELGAGSEVEATGREVDTPVGDTLLGRVLDATGRVRDGGAPLQIQERRAVEQPAPPMMDRAPVQVPLQTGLKAVDALIPIGRGQRELIVGDRQTGKTSIAVGSIINQRDTDVISIYCAIGQRGTAVARVVDALREHEALERTIVLVASGEDPPGLQYITPYAAMSMGEYFMEQGHDVLIVYDDLTRHARAYRELSLLLRRPPGREAYPGDIFYLHSRLLERATHLSDERGGGSLTALPIIETQAQDISAYIPTNLISITDGQIYVSPELFRKGMMPAIDIGKSVSRVGGKTQLPAYRKVAGDLRLAYSQFEELETFARFGTRLDEDTRATIERGRRVREILKQHEYQTLSVSEQITALLAVNSGMFDGLELEQVGQAEQTLRAQLLERHPELWQRIDQGETLSDDDWEQLQQALRSAADSLQSDPDEARDHGND
jgi:F-type H+-transporting ATPase subunit alpha